MASENAKVEAIRQRILSEADDEAARILGEARGAAQGLLERGKAQADAEASAREAAARAEADRSRKARAVAASSAARARLLAARAETLEAAYRAAREKLEALRQEPAYPETLKALLVEAVLALRPHDDLEVLIDPRDEKTVSDDFLGSVEIVLTFSHNVAVKLRLAPERLACAGGLVVRAHGSNLRCDNTFEERLRAARPEIFRRVAAEVLGQ